MNQRFIEERRGSFEAVGLGLNRTDGTEVGSEMQ